MPIRFQPSFFDVNERTAKLTEMGDPLVGLNERIDWEGFRPTLNAVYEKARKSKAGAKPMDSGVDVQDFGASAVAQPVG